jgi:hypothetical protein
MKSGARVVCDEKRWFAILDVKIDLTKVRVNGKAA